MHDDYKTFSREQAVGLVVSLDVITVHKGDDV